MILDDLFRHDLLLLTYATVLDNMSAPAAEAWRQIPQLYLSQDASPSVNRTRDTSSLHHCYPVRGLLHILITTSHRVRSFPSCSLRRCNTPSLHLGGEFRARSKPLGIRTDDATPKSSCASGPFLCPHTIAHRPELPKHPSLCPRPDGCWPHYAFASAPAHATAYSELLSPSFFTYSAQDLKPCANKPLASPIAHWRSSRSSDRTEEVQRPVTCCCRTCSLCALAFGEQKAKLDRPRRITKHLRTHENF